MEATKNIKRSCLMELTFLLTDRRKLHIIIITEPNAPLDDADYVGAFHLLRCLIFEYVKGCYMVFLWQVFLRSADVILSYVF